MPEDQSRVVESLRSRPWRAVAVVAVIATLFASAAAIRRHSLRNEALSNWAARSSVLAHLTSTSASAWQLARQGDARLLAASAARRPQLFGAPPTPGAPAIDSAALVKSLTQSLTSLNQLHPYTSLWLFDRAGNVMGTTASNRPSDRFRRTAILALAADSGEVSGPFLMASDSLALAFAQRVVAPPAIGAADTSNKEILGSVMIVSDAKALLTDLERWAERSPTETISLFVATSDSVHEYPLSPATSVRAPHGAWARAAAPRFAIAAFEARDTTATLVGSNVVFSTRVDGLPWVLSRSEAASTVFAGVDGRLSTEASTTAAVLFMIAIIIIGRRQTARERKLLEVAESEVRYRLLADNATDVIARHAPDGRILYISPAVTAILGYQPRQLRGHYPSELFHDDDSTTMNDILSVLRITQGVSRAEHRLRHVNGNYVWVETTGRAVRDPVWGQVTELVTVSRDIADRKEAEEALRASEEDYRVLFDANPLPMWAFDTDTLKFVAVNDEAVVHYGYSREEFLGMTILDIRPEGDIPIVRERVANVRAGLTNLQGVKHRKKDGTLMDVDLTVHEVRLSGRMTRLVLVKDVTEAKRTATALHESNELIRALFDSSPVAIVATDLQLRILQWNRAAERLFGWTAAEVVGKPYPLATDAMLPDVHRIRERALRDSTYIDIRAQRQRKDGSLVDVSLSVGVIRDPLLQPAGFVLLAADVSESKKLEEQLRHAQKMDAVGQLAGGIAHDFNNLLTVVTGYAGIILADLPPDDQMRPDINEIIGAADRAGVLTRQLLAFSRQQMLQPKVLDLNVVVHGMEQMLRRVLPADIKFVTNLDPTLSAVNADPGQIEQVLMNLIVNARDAMPDGGALSVETRDFTMSAGSNFGHDIPPGDYSILSVSDTGCGMTKEILARIFEPFYTTKGRGEGNGLGLSTAHGIVTQSGGYLSVQSEPAVGTTITVCLPHTSFVSESGTETFGDEADSAAVILLVEDDPSVRLSTKRILERAGYMVLVACDGSEALALYAERRISVDLLVTDMIMPEMSGRELAARVHERDPHIAVLIMSGYGEQPSRGRTLAESDSAFIHKPFTPDALTEKVRAILKASGIDATAMDATA